MVAKVTSRLSNDLHAKVSINKIDFKLFNNMVLEGALVLDQKNDTLLYAGAANVKITDWFFWRKNIVLKHISLDDAVVNLYRKDSVWNYQFMVNYFSGPKKNDRTNNNIKLDLKEVELNRVTIRQKDAWVGTDVTVSVNRMILLAQDFDLNSNIIKINSVLLNKPVFYQLEYTGFRVKKNLNSVLRKANGLQWNENNMQLFVNNIIIQDGSFVLEKQAAKVSVPGRFDDGHMVVSGIFGSLKNVTFLQDTLHSNVVLKAKDRSGFEIKSLQTAFTFTPDIMEFKNLDLTTNKSHLKNYYAMRYKNFNDDMADFMHSVKLEGNFTASEISSDDIAFFSPDLSTWKRNFNLTGQASGTIDDLKAKNVFLKSGKENFFNGDFEIRGIPITNEMYVDIHSNDLKTSYSQLASFIPSLRQVDNPNLSALGNIRFRGNYKGLLRDFKMDGTVETDLGTLITDINMKIPEKGIPNYSGRISTSNFKLGSFISNSQLGNISFTGNVSGKGFTSKSINILVDGFVKQVQFNDYNFQNINAKGNFKDKLFEGTGSIDDPNIHVDGLRGSIDFSKSQPQFNLDADVSKMNLHELGFTNADFSLTGKFNLNFSGNNIDNFLGSARIYNSVLTSKARKLSFDSLTLISTFLNDKKYLTLQTNELAASVTGNFKILELPDAFQLFLNRYYPSYIKQPRKNISAQDFSFYIKTKDISDYIPLVDKNLKGFNNSEISGDINLASNNLNLKVNTPSFSYNSVNFYDVNFSGKGTYDSLKLVGNVSDVIINDSLHLPDTKIGVTAYNDISDISIKTSASKALNEADFSAKLQTLPDGFRLFFNPSSFVINNKKWILEKGGELTLSKQMLTASEVKFSQENQQLTISTQPSETGNSNDVLIDLKKINLSDFAPFFIKTPRLEGLMTGNIKIEDPFGKLMMEFDTKTEQFRFENDSIGMLKTSGNYSSLTGEVSAQTFSDNDLYNFNGGIKFRTKDSTTNQLSGNLNLNNTSIHFLQKYLSNIFSSIQGRATGVLNISGTGSDPKITGGVALYDASMIVNYTRCKYLFNNNSIITFNKDEIDFGTLKIRDTLNNPATVTGKMYHTFFDNFFFNELHFKTDRKNGGLGKCLLLNTSSRDNKEFYGKVIGDADLTLNGPVNDMRMDITAQATDSSHIYLPTGETAESGSINYIDFIQFGKEMQPDLSAREDANIKVDMQLTANPFVKIDVILDETTGDVIKAQGSGKLNITAGTKDPLLIRGRYDIQQGEYTFNFQTFLKTPFTLQQGFIEWQGDPYLANLNIDAVYRAQKVDLSSIVTSSGSANIKGDVDIIFKLRGTLKDTRPDFEFQFPFDNPLRSDPIANEYLRSRFLADKNEMNKQVTSLLLFNTFMPESQSLFTRNNTGNFVTRTLGQVLSSTLSTSLNNWLQKLLKTNAVNLYTNINTSEFNFQGASQQLQQVQNLGTFGVKTAFLNNRLLVNVGGNVDYRQVQTSTNSNTNFLFTPDVSFEYLVTPDGKFRVVGFNRSDASLGDITGLTRRNRTGVLLSYRKDFSTFAEFFNGDKKKKSKFETPNQN